MLTSYHEKIPPVLTSYRSAPNAGNRSFWQSLDSKHAMLVHTHALDAQKQAFPALLATEYLAFSRKGSRIAYESPYFKRRTLLASLVLGYCIERSEAMLDAIIDGIWAICEETTWCLPAHNSYIRDTEQLPLADVNRPVIDLFSAETGALLAQTYSLISYDLEGVSPLLPKRIIDEIEKRIFTPYTTEHFWWMGNEDEPMNNWTVWCTQNVLLCTFLLPTGQAFRKKVFEKALYSMDCFLKDYGDDGCCSEGAQYFRHAGLCLYLCLDILNQVSNNALMDVFNEPKIRNIASYIRHMHAQGPYYFNFSDCSPLAGSCTIREYLFAKAVGDVELERFALASRNTRNEEEKDLPDQINLTYRLLELIHASSHALKTSFPQESDHFYPSVGIFISRDDTYALSVKAGGNDDSHNHNDTGSITLFKNGTPILIDVGVETYTKQTFSNDRYSIWTMRSIFHNVTNFPPFEQLAGKEYKSEILELGETSTISLQLKACYDPGCPLRSYKRTVTHSKGKEIMLREEVEGDVKPVLTLMSMHKPTVQENIITLGEAATLEIQTPFQSITVEEIPITDARLRSVWPEKIYRVLVFYETNLIIHIQ
jgi:hypothetical protein